MTVWIELICHNFPFHSVNYLEWAEWSGVFARFANHPFRCNSEPELAAAVDASYEKYYYKYYNKTRSAMEKNLKMKKLLIFAGFVVLTNVILDN